MRIKSISVYGLFGSWNHHIELTGEGLTFIHSQNGVGKSITLTLTYYLFRGDIESLRQFVFQRMDVGFDDGTVIIVENEDTFRLQVSRNEVEEPITAEEVSEMFDVLYMSPERTIVQKMDGHLVPALDLYVAEFTDRILSAQKHDTLEPVPEEKKIRKEDDEFVFWCKDLKARLDFIEEAGFSLKMPSGLRFPPTRFEYSESKEEYVDLANSISAWVDRNYSLAESVVVYLDIVNRLFYNKTVYLNERKALSVKMEDGNAIPMNRLSAGEKQIMIIFYRLLFHTKPGCLAIVDEPENSLHVSWQQRIGQLFLDISRTKNIQILVATHSPQIIHDRWDLARELKPEHA